LIVYEFKIIILDFTIKNIYFHVIVEYIKNVKNKQSNKNINKKI